jgi:hypothetical protein
VNSEADLARAFVNLRHGSRYLYAAGCRCAACVEAARDYATRRRRRLGAKARKRADTHGTRSMYQGGCRCEACRRAHRLYAIERARKLGRRPRPQARHGTRSKYQAGCRCGPCRGASRAYERTRAGALPRGRAEPLRESIPALLTDAAAAAAVELARRALPYARRGTGLEELISVAYLDGGEPRAVARRAAREFGASALSLSRIPELRWVGARKS